MGLKQIVAPDGEPITLDEAKKHLRVDSDITDEDGTIIALITAARESAEGFQGRAYLSQTWELTLDCWPSNSTIIELPKPPLQSVTSIKYKDADGVEHTWDATNYIVDTTSLKGRISLATNKSWPSGSLAPIAAITIRFVAGYGTADKVPARFKQAMKLLLAHWYEHREEVNVGSIVTEMPMAAQSLLSRGGGRVTF